MQNKRYILSTRPLTPFFINEAAQHNIIIEEVSFIQTKEIEDEKLTIQIKELSAQPIVVVFTSMNAVEAVAKHMPKTPHWKVYCIGNTTKKLIAEKLGVQTVAGTAENAESLADTIINDKNDKVVFFCGNIRREELPYKLRMNNVTVEEITVYNTLETAKQVSKEYDGILFFSPSAVHSFFSVNKPSNQTQYFAIGATTKSAVQQYTGQNVIVAEAPDKESLAKKAIDYFSTLKIG